MNRGISANQASLASPSNPIRGITTNTVANVRNRVPILGFNATGISLLESKGKTWYDGLQTSLTKRMSKGLQMLASYTWAKALDTDGAKAYNSDRAGGTPGDQNDPQQRTGPSELSRAHRFVTSALYEVPNLADPDSWAGRLVNGWSVAGVGTFQTGNWMSILYTNGTNVTGTTSDRAQRVPGCTNADLVTSGPLKDKLNNYFNAACFTTPPVVGDDGRATAFGSSGVGIVEGPGQYNVDMSIMKRIALGSSRRLEVRFEFFNLFNTPQFSNPDNVFGSATFGRITSAAVNPRFIQLAAKLNF